MFSQKEGESGQTIFHFYEQCSKIDPWCSGHSQKVVGVIWKRREKHLGRVRFHEEVFEIPMNEFGNAKYSTS